MHAICMNSRSCMGARDYWQRLPLSNLLIGIQVRYMGLRTCTYKHVRMYIYNYYDPSRNLLNVEYTIPGICFS